MYIYFHAHTYRYIYIYMYIYIYIYMYMCVNTHTHMYIYHSLTHVYVSLSVYSYVCVFTYIYMYIYHSLAFSLSTGVQASLVRVYSEGTPADRCAYEPDAWLRLEYIRRAFHVLLASQVFFIGWSRLEYIRKERKKKGGKNHRHYHTVTNETIQWDQKSILIRTTVYYRGGICSHLGYAMGWLRLE